MTDISRKELVEGAGDQNVAALRRQIQGRGHVFSRCAMRKGGASTC